jgi:hypothetical protein
MPLGGIKYTKSTVRNQSIIQESFSSLLHPKWCLMSIQQVLKMVDFGKPVNYISVDLPIFDTPYRIFFIFHVERSWTSFLRKDKKGEFLLFFLHFS